MKFTEYVGSQFGNPRGVFGKLCCMIMNMINIKIYNGVCSSLDINSSSRILEIGYGNGNMLNKLYKKSKSELYGIDISEDMKISASKRNSKGVSDGKIHLEIGDCCSLQYEDSFFDAVTTVNTIYFWEDTLKGMSEIYRVLKKGGIFSNGIYSKAWMEKAPYTKNGFKLFYPEEVKQLAQKAGFIDVEIKEIKSQMCYVINCRK